MKAPRYAHCGTKASLIGRLFFLTILLCLIAQNRLCSLAAVARVPDLIRLASALEGSRCDVREEIVSVRHEHPSLPSNAIYSPSCVKLNRCSGCCDSDSMRCVPTSEYTTRIEISELIKNPHFSYGKLVLEFTHHGSCECRSRDEARPSVCVQKACESQETWDVGQCRCLTIPDVTCVEKACRQGQTWNGETCECESSCVRRTCTTGERWNEDLCNCEASCQIERCPPGQIIDLRTCSCAPKCPAKACPSGEFWNPKTCSCQCKSCYHRRINRRLSANALRCLCACNFEWRRRARCESRRRIFTPETCSRCRSRTSHYGR